MGVDHGGFDILLTEEFLDGADIVAIPEELGGERMAEGMRGNGFIQARGQHCLPDGLLYHSDIQMMPFRPLLNQIHGMV
jgi:hypothetical protein